MIRLTRVEAKRLLARRFTWLILIGAVLMSGLVLYGVNDSSKNYSPQSQAQNKATFEQVHEDWVKNHVRNEKDCTASMPTDQGMDPKTMCEQREPRLEDFQGGTGGLDGLFNDALSAIIPMVVFLTFLLSASLVAAEFSTGTLGNWLTFEPRRNRVFVSKILAAVLAGAVLATVMAALVGVGVWLIAGRVDLTADASGGQRQELIATFARLVPIGVFGAILGSTVGFIVRHTAAAIGALMAYFVGFEGLLRATLPGLQKWSGSLNVEAFVHHGREYYIDKCSQGNGMCTPETHWLSFPRGSIYLLVVAVILLALANMLFRRRDVT